MVEDKSAALRRQIAALVGEYASLQYAERAFVPGETPVPPSGKLIGAEELQAMVEASLDGWLTAGRFNEDFEKKLAAFLGVKFAMTVNSGSSANLIAFSTLTDQWSSMSNWVLTTRFRTGFVRLSARRRAPS